VSVDASVVAERPSNRPTLLEQYRLMALIRRFEDRAAELFQQGVIFGTAHSCVGQEAIAVGAAGVMRDTDYLVGHHRSHGHLIAAGADLRRMMAEMFGKRTGYCKGLGGSMHIADLSLDILGCNGIVGAGLPHACGAALTAKLRGTGQAAVAFFGDGAAGQGAAHEGMNLAATWSLPVVFICENNQFALSADWRAQRAVEDLADRAAGYGMAGEIVDGNDLLAVEDAVARALDRAREGAGPTFLEMKTFRRMQHSMRANLPDVRDPALVEEWEAKDPLPRLERLLRDVGALDDDRVEGVLREVEADVELAIETALADEDASADDLLPAVFAAQRSYPAPAAETERKLGFVAAVREALDLELDADPNVIVIGEDIGKVGGLFRATEGLYERFGGERIRDTPLTESGFVGCGIGAALTGLRPVVELQFSDFAGVAFDQIMNQAAKLRFMMGGTPSIPLVIRMVSGGGVRLGAQHSQSLEALFAHIPGLVVAMPSTPYDAKGLLSAAIRGDNPVIFLEQKLLFFGEPEPVPEERYGIELGVGRVAREGTDVTVVALGALVPHALRAAHELEGEGVSVEIVDPRTLVPLDTALIAESVAKTHRLVVAHEAVQFCGFGSEIAAHAAEHCFWDLDAPVIRVGAASHPIPYQKDLEVATLPGPAEIVAAVRSLASG
jgi:2-oxoisovalerate dehydrogenase E1 component